MIVHLLGERSSIAEHVACERVLDHSAHVIPVVSRVVAVTYLNIHCERATNRNVSVTESKPLTTRLNDERSLLDMRMEFRYEEPIRPEEIQQALVVRVPYGERIESAGSPLECELTERCEYLVAGLVMESNS